jgi:hypothetical protein
VWYFLPTKSAKNTTQTDMRLRRRRIAAACSRNDDALFERYWGLGVANPRKMLVFWFFCGESAKKPKQKGVLGYAPSMGFTYWGCEGTVFPCNLMIVGYVVFSPCASNAHCR